MNRIGNIFIWSLAIPVAFYAGPLYLPLYQIIIILVCFPVLFHVCKTRSVKFGLIDVFLLSHCLWVSLIYNIHHDTGTAIEASGNYFLNTFVAFLFGKVAVRSSKDFLNIIKSITYILIIMMPFIVIENISGRNIIHDIFSSIFPLSPRPALTERLGLLRAHGSFPHFILFGIFSGFSISVVYLCLKKFRYFSIPVLFYSTLASLSTGPLLIAVLQVIFLSWNQILRRVTQRWWILFGLFLFFYIVIDALSNRTPFHVFVDYLTFNTGSGYARILIWHFGMISVQNYPLFGIGLNPWDAPSWMGTSIDNFWLLTAIKYGILGFLLLFIACATMFLKACFFKVRSDPKFAALRLGWCLSVMALFIVGSTVHFFGAIMPLFMFFLGMGALFYQAKPYPVPRGAVHQSRELTLDTPSHQLRVPSE